MINKTDQQIFLPLGLPLEIIQKGWIGSAKVALVFFSGVIFGSMASAVFEGHSIVGSSSGTYALIFAHIGIKHSTNTK